MNLDKDTAEIGRWMKGAFVKARDLVHQGNKTDAVTLLTDIEAVWQEYEKVFDAITPPQTFKMPFPKKNLWAQLGWVTLNLATVAEMAASLSGDIFMAARSKAQEVAAKWGWTY